MNDRNFICTFFTRFCVCEFHTVCAAAVKEKRNVKSCRRQIRHERERRAVVLTIGNYVKAKTLEEAYELNQARSSRVMGGMMWNAPWKREGKDSD